MNSSSSQKIHSPTFNEIMSAVNQVSKICDRNGTIPKSEIYNETWMLRLTLALLKEIDIGQLQLKEDENHISEITTAVRSGWISEGGLKPVFKREHTTWTDAILGRVYCDENDRNVKIKGSNLLEGDEYEGIIVVEAKMASELSRDVKNSPDYDQVARNVACLAKFVMRQNDGFINNCAFILLGPREKCKSWKGISKYGKWDDNHEYGKWDDNVWETIKVQRETRTVKKGKKQINVPERKLRNDEMTDDEFYGIFKKAVDAIVFRSRIISWDRIIETIKPMNDRKRLEDFYDKAKRFSKKSNDGV